MIGPGLARLLDIIKSNPADTILVDRFLVLAADTPEYERAEAVLRLGRALIQDAPRKAIEVSWMVYKSSLRDMESLAVIGDALDRLGKNEKADRIRLEARRLASGKLSDDDKSVSRITIEEHVTMVLSGGADPVAKTSGPSVSDFVGEPTKSNFLPLAHFDLESTPPTNENLVIKPFQVKDSKLDMASATVLLPSENKAPDKPPAGDKAVAVMPSSVNQVSAEGSVARVSVAAPGAGIPEAIPAKEESRHVMLSLNQTSRSRQGSAIRENAQSHLIRPRSMTPDERMRRLTDLIAAEEWESFLELLGHSYPTAEDPRLLKLFETQKLYRIDIRFASWWIDILIVARQERRALRFILQQLNDEPHLAWARMVWPKVKIMRESLNLSDFDWRESDGVAALRDRICGMNHRLGCYWVTPPIAS
jgi:hypothetical protein